MWHWCNTSCQKPELKGVDAIAQDTYSSFQSPSGLIMYAILKNNPNPKIRNKFIIPTSYSLFIVLL